MFGKRPFQWVDFSPALMPQDFYNFELLYLHLSGHHKIHPDSQLSIFNNHIILDQLQFVDYAPQYERAFHDLNEEWISQYFTMEASDHKALDNAQTYIIDKGGFIIVALYEQQPIGVCALIKMHDSKYDFELAKMAVSPTMRGQKVGWRLAQAIIEKAKSVGATWLYLESNTKLETAVNLYHKLGFVKVAGVSTPYQRCNIQMELAI